MQSFFTKQHLLFGLILLVSSFLVQSYLPWWSIALAGFATAFFIKTTTRFAFWTGFIGNFALWFGYMCLIHLRTEGILSNKVAQILPLQGNAYLLMLIASLLAALVGGLATLAGNTIKES